jgi:hypothetical protein
LLHEKAGYVYTAIGLKRVPMFWADFFLEIDTVQRKRSQHDQCCMLLLLEMFDLDMKGGMEYKLFYGMVLYLDARLF